MRRATWIVVIAAVALLLGLPAHAGEAKPVQGYIAGGYSQPIGDADDFAEGGWNLSGGVILRPAAGNQNFGLRFDIGYNEFNAKEALLNLSPSDYVRTDGGWVSMATITADALYHFGKEDGVKGYVGLGFGAYRRYVALYQYSTYVGCDPYWGWCYPVSGVTVTNDDKLTKFGYNASVGVTFPVGNGDMFVEARYHYMDAEINVQYIPIVIGYRF